MGSTKFYFDGINPSCTTARPISLKIRSFLNHMGTDRISLTTIVIHVAKFLFNDMSKGELPIMNTRCTKLSMVRDDSKSSKTSNKKCHIYVIVQLMFTDKLAHCTMQTPVGLTPSSNMPIEQFKVMLMMCNIFKLSGFS